MFSIKVGIHPKEFGYLIKELQVIEVEADLEAVIDIRC
jgi:hypothetical protein